MLGTDRPDLYVDDPHGVPHAIWDDETGETWAQARERFATLGRVVWFSDLRAMALSDDYEVMSFGYGDDPEDFVSVTIGELKAALYAGDTYVNIDTTWGPFALPQSEPDLLDTVARSLVTLAGAEPVDSQWSLAKRILRDLERAGYTVLGACARCGSDPRAHWCPDLEETFN